MKHLLKQHISVSIFVILMVFISVGVIVYSGTQHLDKLALVTVSLIGFYWAMVKTGYGTKLQDLKIPFLNKHANLLEKLLLVGCFGIFILDMVILKGPPGMKVFDLTYLSEMTELRGNIHSKSPTIVVYLSAINLKAFIPFAILHFLIKRKRIIVISLLALATFYGFAMMQKSFILSMLVPGLIYVIYQRQYYYIGAMILSIATVLVATTLVSVNLENDTMPADKTVVDNRPKALRIVIGLSNRIFIVPGEIVSKWFDHVPKDKPYLNGDGYPIIAKIKGTKFVNYSKELYPLIRPDYVKRGLKGTVNVATFVREYANFGYPGLVLSGFILALIFYLIQSIFAKDGLLFACINLFPILLLSSLSVLTILLSGGWAMLIILYLSFKDQYTSEELCVA